MPQSYTSGPCDVRLRSVFTGPSEPREALWQVLGATGLPAGGRGRHEWEHSLL